MWPREFVRAFGILYCSIIPLNLEKHKKHLYKKKYNLIFFDVDVCMEQVSTRREFAHAKELLGAACEDWLQPYFSTLYNFKTPSQPTRNTCFSLVTALTYALLFFMGHDLHPRYACFNRSRLTSTHYLIFIGHGLHPCNTCSLLVTAHNHALHVFW